jgi:lipoprotein-anchoring transpeptidase ErfK/SrfK
MHSKELHYRPAQFWAAGTKVSVRSDLDRLQLPGGVWGAGVRTSEFTIGDAVVSTVDVAAHTMTVRRNGEVLRVLPASMGKPEFPTRAGVHLVLEKEATKVMNSDTVGLPGEYRTKVDWAVRLTYSGTFTHSAPWSVKDQGVRNVSHGCVNLSPADAKWFYDNARRGDVVEVVNSPVGPKLDDPGAADWNLSFADWKRPA